MKIVYVIYFSLVLIVANLSAALYWGGPLALFHIGIAAILSVAIFSVLRSM